MERSTAELEAWLDQQAEVTRNSFDGDELREALRKRMFELHRYARAPVPIVAGGLWFSDGQYPGEFYTDIRVQQGPDEDHRILVAPHEHPAVPGESVAMSGPIPSPYGDYVLYGASSRSMRDCIRFVEVETGTDLAEDVLPVRYWPWVVDWLPDGDGVVYARGSTVRLHYLGEPVQDDLVVFRDRAKFARNLAVHAGADGTSVLVSAFHPTDGTSAVYFHRLGIDSDSENPTWIELTKGASGYFRIVGTRGSRVYLYNSSRTHPKGRIVAVDVDTPQPEHWREVVPEQNEPVMDDNHPMRDSVGLFADRLAGLYTHEGHLLLRAFDLEGKLLHEKRLPTSGFNESGLLGHGSKPVARFDHQSMIDPGTALEFDLETGSIRSIGTAQIPFDSSKYVLRHTSYESFDGTRVPIFLAHRKGIELDGSHAVAMNNRSGGGMVARPLYLPSLFLWLDLGGVFALPGIRGGGELGEDWHRAGAGKNKPIAVKDFIAAAEWVVEAGYSRPENIGVMGMSASGPLPAAAVLQRPEAFGACLIQISRLDILERGWSAEEFGNLEVAEDFRAALSWSPYQNVREGEYPPFLVQVGSNDTVTPPHHGYKFIAALQRAQRSEAPVLLQVVKNAGHSQGFGLEQQADTYSLQYAFLARSLLRSQPARD